MRARDGRRATIVVLGDEDSVRLRSSDMSGDVVLASPQIRLEPDALDALAAAARSETTVATASFDRAPSAPRIGAIACRIDRPKPGCTYVRREALDLVGVEALLADDRDAFARACLRQGLIHVAADEWVVRSGDAGGVEMSAAEEPISVTIDARCLEHPVTGTQVHVLELIGALARHPRLELRALVPPTLNPDADRALVGIRGVSLLREEDVRASAPTDVAHRPYQVFALQDVALLRKLGRRIVVTQQDLIAYRNAAYFTSDAEWERYRELTRTSLDAVDAAVFFSAYAARDAFAAELVAHPSVVHVGTDHSVLRADEAAAPRQEIAAPFIACLGTDFVHKNRVFALRVFEQLVRRHDWPGLLVFSGPHMPAAVSSAADEEAFLGPRGDLAARVFDLGPVSEPTKRWLLQRAALVVYPSVVEGFGLIPFEAAAESTACLFAAQAALGETMPEHLAAIVPWDAERTAAAAAALLTDATASQAVVGGIAAAGAQLTWDACARELVRVYRRALAGPPKPTIDVPAPSRPSAAARLRRRAGVLRARLR